MNMTIHDPDCALATIEWSSLLTLMFGPQKCECVNGEVK